MKALLFDFDGTLVNTAIDMVNSLKELAENHHIYQSFNLDDYKQYVSAGAMGLVKSIFGDCDQVNYDSLKQEYLNIYQQHFNCSNHLFEGVEEVLCYLDRKKIKWGIVTNKPSWLARPIIRSMTVFPDTMLIICADEIDQPKPDPAGLILASAELGVEPAECYYLGDAQTDVLAAHNAGMQALIAKWGYLPQGVDIEQWGASHIIEKAVDLMNLF